MDRALGSKRVSLQAAWALLAVRCVADGSSVRTCVHHLDVPNFSQELADQTRIFMLELPS